MGSIGNQLKTPYRIAMQESSIPKRISAISKIMTSLSVGEQLQLNEHYALQKGRDDIYILFEDGVKSYMMFKKQWLKELTATKTKNKYL